MIRNNFNDIIFVNSKKVSCGGSDESSLHPLIYLQLNKQESAICPYCNKVFSIQKEHHKANFDKKSNNSKNGNNNAFNH